MVIQDLKPSRRVEGRWLAVLEDGSILRLGEGEVVDFALYAGKELSEGEAEALTQAARRSGLRQKALNLLTSKPMSRRELEQKLRSWEAGEEEAAAIADRMEELGFLNDAAYAAQVVRYYSAGGFPGSCGTRPWRGPRTPPPPLRSFCGKSGGARSPMIHGS